MSDVIFLLGGGSVLLLLAIREIVRAREFRSRAALTQGEVVDVRFDIHDDWTHPIVTFPAEGRMFTLEDMQVGLFKVGKRIPVLYLPENPEVARLGGKYLFRAAWAYGVWGAVFIVVGAFPR